MNTLYPTYKSRSIEFKKLFPGLPPEERLVVGKGLFTHAFLQYIKFMLSSTTVRTDRNIHGEIVLLSKVLFTHSIMQYIKFMLSSTTGRTARKIHSEIVFLSKVLFTHAFLQSVKFMLSSTTVRTDWKIHGEIAFLTKCCLHMRLCSLYSLCCSQQQLEQKGKFMVKLYF
jgi:hypothetical protein